jgi:protein-disulfide isomerase
MSNSINPSVSRGRAVLAFTLLLGLCLYLPACSAADGDSSATAVSASDEVVAVIGGNPVSMTELEEIAAPQLKQIERQRYQILEGALNQLVEKKLLELAAEKKGVTTDELLEAEVNSKITEVSDAEVDAWFEANQARVGNRSKEEIAPQIKQFLAQQRGGDVRNTYLASLREQYDVKIRFEPPRAKVEVANAPIKGGKDAAVTIVEFSDFECPYCSSVTPTLKKIEETYGDKVRIAFRHFPLGFHSKAQKAAEAAMCAQDQGKFWQMHDAMFGDQKQLEVAQLKATAANLGLDAEKFNECLDSGTHADAIKADMEAGQAAGVSGTPAFFINGRMVEGAVPYEQLASVIDAELDRVEGE